MTSPSRPEFVPRRRQPRPGASRQPEPAATAAQDLDAVRRYVERNRRQARQGRRCVDGRYQPRSEESGRLARAGGDLGYALALAALNQIHSFGLSTRECFERVYDVVTREGGTFDMHTAAGAPPPIGCKHCAAAADPVLAIRYSVQPSSVLELIAVGFERAAAGDRVRIVTLSGESRERRVLIITGRDQTVDPHDEGEAAYVYDRTRDLAFAERLVRALRIERLSAAHFIAMLDQQTEASLSLVAAGLPRYAVNADGAEVEVTPLEPGRLG